MNILVFDWCGSEGVQKIFELIQTLLTVIRWVVPIGLIVMTSIDIAKKVINPDDKDGQAKLMNRIIAAVVVFLVPILVRLVLTLVDVGLGNTPGETNSITGDCWR